MPTKNMSVAEIVTLNNAVTMAIGSLKNVSVKLGMRLTYNVKQFEDVVTAFEAERKKLLEQYAQRDEAGEMVVENGQVVLSDRPAFEAAFKALTDERYDIPFKALDEHLFPESVDASIVAGLYPIIIEGSED